MLHRDLLEQAEDLARLDHSGGPRQASLRRAVSAAYYALFHMLLHEATLLLLPADPPTLRSRARRGGTHQDAKKLCNLFARSEGVKNLTVHPIEAELREIATTFVELQEARHQADYDMTESFDRVQVLERVAQARRAMENWEAIKNTPNANVFLVALLVSKWWSK